MQPHIESPSIWLWGLLLFEASIQGSLRKTYSLYERCYCIFHRRWLRGRISSRGRTAPPLCERPASQLCRQGHQKSAPSQSQRTCRAVDGAVSLHLEVAATRHAKPLRHAIEASLYPFSNLKVMQIWGLSTCRRTWHLCTWRRGTLTRRSRWFCRAHRHPRKRRQCMPNSTAPGPALLCPRLRRRGNDGGRSHRAADALLLSGMLVEWGSGRQRLYPLHMTVVEQLQPLHSQCGMHAAIWHRNCSSGCPQLERLLVVYKSKDWLGRANVSCPLRW